MTIRFSAWRKSPKPKINRKVNPTQAPGYPGCLPLPSVKDASGKQILAARQILMTENSRGDMMIELGVIRSKAELPPGLISRSEANKYLDVNTLAPMVPLIEDAGLIQYSAIVNGKIAVYLNLGEAQTWGAERGYDFWPSSEISEEWREYLKTLDRIYRDVERLKALAERMEFDQEEMTAVPTLDRQHWPWGPKAMSLRDPRLRQATARRAEREKAVPLAVYRSLQDRYKRVRKKLAAIISGDEKRPVPLSIKQSGNRFFVRVQRKVLGEKVNLYRSFMLQADAIQWAHEMSEELDVLAAMKQMETGALGAEPGSLSKFLLDPTEYLKAGNGYLVEMARKVVATENPSADGRYAPVEAIHTHSIRFEDTLVCGIYFLIDQGEIVYVGQSVDVFKRIREHRQEGYKKWDRFSMIPVREEKLTEVETWYIQHFRPRYNKTRQQPRPSEAKVHNVRVKTEDRLRKAARAELSAAASMSAPC